MIQTICFTWNQPSAMDDWTQAPSFFQHLEPISTNVVSVKGSVIGPSNTKSFIPTSYFRSSHDPSI